MLHALAAGFYVLLYGTVVALAFAAAWFADEGSAGVDWLPDWIPGWALAFWCAFTALFLVLAQLGVGRRRAAGRPLTREEAPRLFDLLDDVGERVGVGTISTVRLKPAPLMAAARVLRPGRFVVTERRALVLGVPLLRLLSVEQLRGAVAHELAHLARGDVRRGRVVNAASRRIALMRAVLERRRGAVAWPLTYLNPVWWGLVTYGSLLRRGAAVIRRRQESRADGLAACVVGASAYADALVRIACVGIAFRRLAPGMLVRAAEEKRSIGNFFEEFASGFNGLSEGALAGLVRDALATHGEEGSDHPPLRDRLEDLGVERAELVEAGDVCGELVPELSTIEAEMTPLVLRGLMLGMGAQIRRRRERREAVLTRS